MDRASSLTPCPFPCLWELLLSPPASISLQLSLLALPLLSVSRRTSLPQPQAFSRARERFAPSRRRYLHRRALLVRRFRAKTPAVPLHPSKAPDARAATNRTVANR